ncbi:DNA topoisomerase 3 [Paenibacillus camelliae]|uniref:DNA topoisomerase 3 n=1 Tax=Paenibacillus camelliae TaxID=512410 RepID=UPI002041493F|nr:DNA topoisomerase 3 [Paenibacillus camelliae]MCM3631755.1 DNA topoisomerase 3 [Paenibacillus camelliae]
MKTLIIAEKPDMGRNIAAAIEPKAKNMRTYIEGEHYIITWAIGHLVGLAEPDAYDDRYKKWSIVHLPIIPSQFKLIANKRTADQLKVIKELASRCNALVNACDAGREGQYIFSLIQRYLQLKQPVERLWISDLTVETIRKGFAELKPGHEYDNLTKAASARSEADWLIGMNGTRAFTTKHNELLSVGRVQTPVLALIYDREAEIAKFDSLKYFVVEASFKQGETTYKGLWQGDRMTDQAKAELIASQVKGKQGSIDQYEAKEVKEYPHRLYDLTLLQREANSKLNFSAKKTLDIAQSLYEKHKVITYPRTNSNYVNEQNIAEMHKALQALQGTQYGEWVAGANRSFVHAGNKSICNPAKVEDHHAILPTAKRASSLSSDEQKLYDLIVKRFLSQYYPPAQYISHVVLTKVEEHLFKTNIKQLVDLGWKMIYGDQQETNNKRKKKGAEEEEDVVEQQEGFELDANAPVHCRQAAAKEKETKPPKSYTEGTLLKAMESAGKQIEDDEAREAMKDCGLGTPATRAATIERLKQVGYITMQGKRITITSKGTAAIELIRGAGIELLTSPEMTGIWEKRLNDIARGRASSEQFMENVKKFATMIVDKVKVQPAVRFEFEKQQKGKTSRARTSSSKAKTEASAAKGADAEKRTRSTRKTADESKQRVNAAAESIRTSSMPNSQRLEEATARQTVMSIAPCPRQGCGGHLIMGKKGYGCSHYKQGCGFVIWRDAYGAELSSQHIQSLVHQGKTPPLSLKRDNGDTIQAELLLTDRNTGTLAIEPLRS